MKKEENYYPFDKFGYTIETAVTPTSCPPGKYGIGGNMICSWIRINKGQWRQDIFGHEQNISDMQTKGDLDIYLIEHELIFPTPFKQNVKN